MKPALSGWLAVGLLVGTIGAPTSWAQSVTSDEPGAIAAQEGGTSGGGGGGGAEGSAQAAPQRAPDRGRARLASTQYPLIRGEALVRQMANNRTGVVVTVYGLEPGSTVLNHIHNGSCTGAILFPLNNLVADRNGTARAVSTVPAAINFDTWWINVHASYALPSPGITCGDVDAPPAPRMAPMGERPGPMPAPGGGQPGSSPGGTGSGTGSGAGTGGAAPGGATGSGTGGGR